MTQCVKGNLLLPSIPNLLFIYFGEIIQILNEALKLKNNTRNWFCNPKKPILDVLHIILWQVDTKLILSYQLAAILIHANNKNCPKGVQGQTSCYCFRTPNPNHTDPKEYKSGRKPHREEHFSRSPNEFTKRTNRILQTGNDVFVAKIQITCFYQFPGLVVQGFITMRNYI